MKRLMMIHLLIILQLGAYHMVNGEILSPDSTVKNNSLGLIHSCDSLKERFCQNYDSNHLYDDMAITNGEDGFMHRFFLPGNALKDTRYKVSLKDLKLLIPPSSYAKYDPTIKLVGVRFRYGVSNANEFVLIFQSVVLLPIAGGYANVVDSVNAYYTKASGGWFPIDEAGLKDMTSRYIKNIMIIHEGEITPSTFDIKKDTKSCIMTVQEILQEYYDNLNGDPADEKNLIEFVLLADKLSGNIATEYKLHVAAYYKVPGTFPINFYGHAADFAELCPTNCSTIKLNVTPK